MNDTRKVQWIESISELLYKLHISVENLFPKNKAELLDISEFSESSNREWIKNFKDILDGTN